MSSTTVNITAADVNKLRTQTGAGMMDCKKALTEAEGDFEKAVDILRKKGQKVAANRGDREAKEGYVIAKLSDDKKFGAIISLNCETDFVAINADFTSFANKISDMAMANRPENIDALNALTIDGRSIAENITDYVGKIGEKIELGKYEFVAAECVTVYNHPGNRVATIVGFNKTADEQVMRDVAMQAAAMAPVALDKDQVDASILEREIEIGKEQARAEGKPEEMLEKIALGKLNKFYKENTLLNQDFIKDNKKTVAQYMNDSEKGLTSTCFKRVALG
jgi:elongation factor Ts